jgi:membrane-bound serine protease (ClpP class)
MDPVATVVTLIVVGALLILLETLLPGMIAGTIGSFSVVAGVILSYQYFGLYVGNLVLLGVCAGLVVGVIFWLKYFPESRVAQRFVSQSSVGDIGTARPDLLHQTGTAVTSLRPSGTAVINGKRIDVVTEGGMIDKDTPIKVVAVEGMRVVVRATE